MFGYLSLIIGNVLMAAGSASSFLKFFKEGDPSFIAAGVMLALLSVMLTGIIAGLMANNRS